MKVFAGLLVIFLAGFLVLAEAGYRVCPNKQRPGCICPAIFSPVCSKIGCTHSNECTMKCSGQELWHPGPCKRQSSLYG